MKKEHKQIIGVIIILLFLIFIAELEFLYPTLFGYNVKFFAAAGMGTIIYLLLKEEIEPEKKETYEKPFDWVEGMK